MFHMNPSPARDQRDLPAAAWIVGTIVLALVLRLPVLDLRPMHTDEAVHAYKLELLRAEGQYTYDPHEYHGPTLYYLTLPVLWLGGVQSAEQTQAWMLRVVPALAGVALIPLLWLIRDALGRWGTATAALLTACSPALVFYSRYYIQEQLLVLFTFGLIACGWRFATSRRLGWALGAGVCCGLMHATKETTIIAWGAMAIALAHEWLRRPRSMRPRGRIALPGLLFLGCAVLTSVACYSVGFRNWQGPIDSLLSYGSYLQRAGGGVHDHPWHYYLNLLLYSHTPARPIWTEAGIVLPALLGAGLALRRGAPLPRFLALYALVMTLVYSAIRYKTPWCMLGFLHAYILLAGYAVERLCLGPPRLRAAAVLLILAIAAHLLYQTNEQSRRYFARSINPLVYGHTVADIDGIAQRCKQIAALGDAPRDALIKVILEDPWPLPWYLRGFVRVGYWETPPDDCDAPLVITSTTLEPRVRARQRQEYFAEVRGIRPDYFAVVLVRRDLWDRFLASQSVPASHPAEPRP